MPVIVWSSTNGGAALSEPLIHGEDNTVSNGDTTAAQTIFIRHNGSNPITSCGLYVSEFTDTYVGDFTALDDKAEVIGWGDETTSADWGGIMINQNADDDFSSSSWPTLADKTSSDGLGFLVRGGVGDSSSATIQIKDDTGATADGTIQAGSSPDVSFQIKIRIPTSLGTSGLRLFGLTLKYNWTS